MADLLQLRPKVLDTLDGTAARPPTGRGWRLEKILHSRVVGQDEAVRSVSDAILRARSGIKNPRRPTGSFIFLGGLRAASSGRSPSVSWLAGTPVQDDTMPGSWCCVPWSSS